LFKDDSWWLEGDKGDTDDNLKFLNALINSCPTNCSSLLLNITGVDVFDERGRLLKHGDKAHGSGLVGCSTILTEKPSDQFFGLIVMSH
jgi:hypothetical protein